MPKTCVLWLWMVLGLQ